MQCIHCSKACLCNSRHCSFLFKCFRVVEIDDVERVSRETDCLIDYIKKGIAIACFYYARCLALGRGIAKDEKAAATFYSRVNFLNYAFMIALIIICFFCFSFFFSNTIFVSSHMYPENPEETQVIVGSMNLVYIYIRHCQESNSQPVPSQAGADTTRPQWRISSYQWHRRGWKDGRVQVVVINTPLHNIGQVTC